VFDEVCGVLVDEQTAFTVTVLVTTFGMQLAVVLYVRLLETSNQLDDADCVGLVVMFVAIGGSCCFNARRRL
jgi:hypothetical protein